MAKRVLIVGAGINGAALARELLLNGVAVDLVDADDICSGTSAFSSRLIHGGLRYLEYRELDLVRESLAERNRWLRLAAHLVRPLRIFIPATTRLGGLVGVARRFLHLERAESAVKAPSRGLYLIRLGLALYDAYAGSSPLPKHAVHHLADSDVPPVDRNRYLALCSYYDAQLRAVERFVVGLLDDARSIAGQRGIPFHIWTHSVLRRVADRYEVVRADGSVVASIPAPDAVVNATGPWVDQTLRQLGVDGPRLVGGTKGSHIGTFHTGLRAALEHGAVYAEAVDGRPFFILPFGKATLIGTTDLPYEGDPRDAVPDDSEIDYLLASVRQVFPQFQLDRSDVAFFYCGVRPLPHVEGRAPSAITRRHFVRPHPEAPQPTFSLIGGKLTVCRSLAELATRAVLQALDVPVRAHSRDRPLPGAPSGPGRSAPGELTEAVRRSGLDPSLAQRLFEWYGTRAAAVLEESLRRASGSVPCSWIPRGLVLWMAEQEWVQRLDDLVIRRLLLVFEPRIHRATLRELARLLESCGRLSDGPVDAAVDRLCDHLQVKFGRHVNDEP